jgi:hypothetical protein
MLLEEGEYGNTSSHAADAIVSSIVARNALGIATNGL